MTERFTNLQALYEGFDKRWNERERVAREFPWRLAAHFAGWLGVPATGHRVPFSDEVHPYVGVFVEESVAPQFRPELGRFDTPPQISGGNYQIFICLVLHGRESTLPNLHLHAPVIFQPQSDGIRVWLFEDNPALTVVMDDAASLDRLCETLAKKIEGLLVSDLGLSDNRSGLGFSFYAQEPPAGPE